MDLEYVGEHIHQAYKDTIEKAGLPPLKVVMECGRMITGPYGYLVTTAIHTKDTYKHYIGLDACMANLMRPALYGAYHHITTLDQHLPFSDPRCKEIVDAIKPDLLIHELPGHGHDPMDDFRQQRALLD